MPLQPPRNRHLDKGSLALGAPLFLVGVAMMAAVIFTAYGTSQASWSAGYRLGLPGTLLASAVAQLLILTGGWLIWRAIPD